MATTAAGMKTDLAVRFHADGVVDLDLSIADLGRVSELDNLVQALQLRLLTPEGALSELGHPRYGSRLGTLIGEPADRENIELLRRYTRKAILRDPRVAEVLEVRARLAGPGVVEIEARVRAAGGGEATVRVGVDLN